jgi:hypothetical protein
MASKRAVRRRACVGKIRHPDKLAASEHCGRLHGPRGKHALHAYRCPFCHGWHIGHGGGG